MTSEKWMWVITGPNGAGKTSFAGNLTGELKAYRRLNPDQLADGITQARLAKGESLPPEDAYKLAFQELKRQMDECRRQGKSFIVETTAPGPSYSNMAQDLRRNGWKIGVIAIGIASPELAMERIRQRSAKGGHENLRWLSNLSWKKCLSETPPLLALADKAVIYDNSGSDIREIATRPALGEKFALSANADEIAANNTYMETLLENMRAHNLLDESHGKDGTPAGKPGRPR